MKKVLIAAPVHAILPRWLQANGFECIIHEKINQEEAQILVADCVGIITSTRLNIDRPLIDAAPILEWVGRMGSGMEIVDVPYAAQKGIACFSSPEGNCNAVAEHALGMLLSLNKKINTSAYEVKNGEWIRDDNRGVEVEGKTIGIIGFGHTGSTFARKLYGFDARILIYDRFKKDIAPKYLEECELDLIYQEADIISFHVPLSPDTFHYLNTAFVDKMQKPFVVINTSRGPVADPAALHYGLQSGKIAGACLDVWDIEPITAMVEQQRALFEKISSMKNVIITPHIAGYSVEALYKMSKSLLDKIVSKK